MKYAVNHPYRFDRYDYAWLAAFFQFTSSLIIEITNLLVICCFSDTLSLVSNFIALVIVAEFDNYVLASMNDETFRLLLEQQFTEKAFIICHTTSVKCNDNEKSNVKDDDDEFRPLKITFGSRDFKNKVYYTLYKI